MTVWNELPVQDMVRWSFLKVSVLRQHGALTEISTKAYGVLHKK